MASVFVNYTVEDELDLSVSADDYEDADSQFFHELHQGLLFHRYLIINLKLLLLIAFHLSRTLLRYFNLFFLQISLYILLFTLLKNEAKSLNKDYTS